MQTLYAKPMLRKSLQKWAAGREDKKVEKYSNLSDNYHFVSVGHMTLMVLKASSYTDRNFVVEFDT